MAKETEYAIVFNHIENVILNLGEDIKAVSETLEALNQRVFVKGKSLYHCMIRLDYLNRVKCSLMQIYNSVNVQTKNMINILYLGSGSFEDVSLELGIKAKRVMFRHNLIIDEMIILLGEATSFDSKSRVERRRSIPKSVKEKVFDRDSGKCVECGSKNNLHYHHIKRYANGGTDTVDNLMLLCVSCHAEEHKDENSYYMLKAMSER